MLKSKRKLQKRLDELVRFSKDVKRKKTINKKGVEVHFKPSSGEVMKIAEEMYFIGCVLQYFYK